MLNALESSHQGTLLTAADGHRPAKKLLPDANESLTNWRESMRVLIVEDDCALGGFLKKGMEMEGHRAEWAEDGEAGLTHAAENHPDLILLDLSLPRRDGIEVLTELRALHNDAAVLVLTGRCDLQSRLQCLDLGADDCLLKPFSFFELTARCRALLR